MGDRGNRGAAVENAGRDDSRDARARRAASAAAALRAEPWTRCGQPTGCPWDRQQTHASARFVLSRSPTRPSTPLRPAYFDALAQELERAVSVRLPRADRVGPVASISPTRLVAHSSPADSTWHPHVFAAVGAAAHGRCPDGGGAARSATRCPDAVGGHPRPPSRTSAARRPDAGRRAARAPALLRAHEIGTRVAAVGFDWAADPPTSSTMIERREVRELRAAGPREPGTRRRRAGRPALLHPPI